MRFQDFARAHGVVIDHVVLNKWVTTATTDHPRSKNGRYKIIGKVGWVQNWATMDKPVKWEDDIGEIISPEFSKKLSEDNKKKSDEASTKAQHIINRCKLETHPYLASKGFPDLKMKVWQSGQDKLLVIPMINFKTLRGVQLIDKEGNKKFLYGQANKGAVFSFGTKGLPIFCEGVATGLSIHEVLKSHNIDYTIYVCFSASNLKFVASRFRKGIVIADNDSNGIGENSAIETGKPYWLSATIGHDFNDDYIKLGSLELSKQLRQLIKV